MEEILGQSGEQPEIAETAQVADAKNDSGVAEPQEKGSPYGKFRDADSLFSAYNSLQAEFTKKCQILSEKEKAEILNESDNATKDEKTEVAPFYLGEGWEEKVADFLSKNSDATKYAEEICSEILKDETLAKNENALTLAYQKVVSKKFVEPEKLAKDKGFLEDYVLSNDEIKKQVLAIYLAEVESNRVPPTISSDKGGVISFSKKPNPKNLAEAKKLAEELFNV
ncbi:MAG: hypothetical protein RR400_02340 [Clostridia bacterium]